MHTSMTSSHFSSPYFAYSEGACVLKDKRKSGCLATNISPHIHNALGESFLWEQMKQSLPDGISDLNTQRSRLSRADSKALAVVQQYNKVALHTPFPLIVIALA